AIGVLIGLWFYTRKWPGQPYLWILDRVAVAAALGGCLIRLGNLFNSEILGRPTQVPWAFVFERVDLVPRHPAQLYESLAYAVIFVGLLLLYRRLRASTPHGLLIGIFLITVFLSRFLIEFTKEEQAAYVKELPLTVGQWLSIPFIIAGAVLFARAMRRQGGR
ncbi:MAG TPA: prolipoprotein diacylglyceryl transferase, partial [Clostridia bacterium]|nr:prolipoprotein diacylglyceryl transferase [Clostridia bacterium]